MKLNGLDHVALAVTDLARSEAWYRDVLGLERRFEDAWGGEPPVMMCAGASCVALFPVEGTPRQIAGRDAVSMRHFAFAASRGEFEAAQRELESRGIAFDFADHGIGHSIYISDPDDHKVEIATYEFD